MPSTCKGSKCREHNPLVMLNQGTCVAVSKACMFAADTPVNLNSPVKDVAALLLAVAEQARLEGPEEAQCPRSSKDSTKASNIRKTKVS